MLVNFPRAWSTHWKGFYFYNHATVFVSGSLVHQVEGFQGAWSTRWKVSWSLVHQVEGFREPGPAGGRFQGAWPSRWKVSGGLAHQVEGFRGLGPPGGRGSTSITMALCLFQGAWPTRWKGFYFYNHGTVFISGSLAHQVERVLHGTVFISGGLAHQVEGVLLLQPWTCVWGCMELVQTLPQEEDEGQSKTI